jgi:hypothetical protein
MKAGTEKIIKDKLSELKEIPEGFHFDREEIWKRLDVRLKLQERESNWWRAIVTSFARIWHEWSRLFAPRQKKRLLKNSLRISRRRARRMHPDRWSHFRVRQKKN